ncbi:uncharacterized protein LOC133554155 [Nerophis ophidion]|uniref:uncharacterized protein LOC133554155 n=1 Tax=Nerophis ophidion TaxID=159077 RepID=UPI002ADF83C8|nr:uncharacterized protein LOC133554155 [Nerophis ophidion]
MGCRLTRNKAHQPSRHRHREEQRFVDQYGQPVGTQGEGRRGRSHRRRRVEHNRTPSERHWEALRAMGLMEAEDSRAAGYNGGHFYDNSASNVYAANNALVSPDGYRTNGYLSRDPTSHGSNYLPSVSYSLDHLDRLDSQVPEMSAYQPNSESCLLGCCNSEESEEHKSYSEQSYRPQWRPLGYLPLSELDSGLGCGPDSPHHRVALSEAETDAMSSLPGNTASSQGSSSSSESLISSEPSDSGFHSVSTGEHRCFHKIQRNAYHLRSGHSPREHRGRWDLESIPETTPMSQAGAPQSSRCTVGNSTTTTVHFHRAERSPTLPRTHSPPSPSSGCRTEPCQRRALWLEQRQGRGGGTIEAPGRSRTLMDLSEVQQHRRASHPVEMEVNTARKQVLSNQPRPASSTPGPRSRASYPTSCPPSVHLSIDALTGHQNTNRALQSGGCSRQEDLRSHELLPRVPSDWRGFQTLGNRTSIQKGSSGPFYSTLGAHISPRSPLSSRSRQSNQKSVRNQLLRARAYRLARERSEVTTDEEMRGDTGRPGDHEGEDGPWAGRYWNRTERRRHLALSRQHRERRWCEEAASVGQGSLSSQMVLELSHRKQNRLRNNKLLDDWITVEELLTHGTRVEADNQLCPSPLLSVTTV